LSGRHPDQPPSRSVDRVPRRQLPRHLQAQEQQRAVVQVPHCHLVPPLL